MLTLPVSVMCSIKIVLIQLGDGSSYHATPLHQSKPAVSDKRTTD